MPPSLIYRPSSRHADLGEAFFDPVDAASFPTHLLRFRNQRWAQRVGLDTLTDAEWLDHFGRFVPLPDNLGRPLALRYHGHQFQVYNPELGDGRGFLFAQLHDSIDGRLLDLGTKGSGRTPWSRGGDGRLTLKGGVRELLASEQLEALGVDTSKTFSLIETGEALHRHDEPSPTRAAVLVRLSHSHIRIGTFQRLAYHEETSQLSRLLEHAVRTYMPELWRDDEAVRAVAFLERVCANVARTAAQWMTAGFVHGVLNTDNINITGESFDYGPWRFLPTYDPGFTAAYFDHSGLYAYGRQPATLLWNLTRLAECLLPLTAQADLERTLQSFAGVFQRELAIAVLRRLGLQPAGDEADNALVTELFAFLDATKAPFERVFFDWYGGVDSTRRASLSPSADLYVSPAFAPVRAALEQHEAIDGIGTDHPYFSGGAPCTMLIDEVEAIWAPIAQADDWSALTAKLSQIAQLRAACGDRSEVA
ncbi:MAG: YdiU family protein [Geminicoccaceae bacterium]